MVAIDAPPEGAAKTEWGLAVRKGGFEMTQKTPEDESEHLPPDDEEEEGDTDEPVGPPKPSGIEEPNE